MISSRILEIISRLSNEQLDRLADFLHSPYHNSGYNSDKIVTLFGLIRDALIREEHDLLEKEHLQHYFYPDHEYILKKKNAIDGLASDFFNRIKDFLFFEHVQSQEFATQRTVALSRFYRLNTLSERFSQVIKQFRKKHTQRKHRNAKHYLDTFWMEAEVAAFRSTFNTYSDDANIEEAERCLDQFYATQKLEDAAILTFQRKVSGQVVDDREETAALISSVYEQYPSFHTPLAGAYRTILFWLKESPTPSAIDDFITKLMQDEAAIEPSKFRNLMAFYRYFLREQYRGNPQSKVLLRKIFKVFQDHLDAGYLLINNKLMPATLKTVINAAIKLNEIEWAKQVLKKYPPAMITGTQYPEEAHSICAAEVLFAGEKYRDALQKLSYCNFENVNYSILADVLLIKIYYAEENELIYNRIPALEKKVRRTKLPAQNKTAYINFLRLMLRILKYEHDKSSNKWQKLEEDFKSTLPMLQREWLQGVINA